MKNLHLFSLEFYTWNLDGLMGTRPSSLTTPTNSVAPRPYIHTQGEVGIKGNVSLDVKVFSPCTPRSKRLRRNKISPTAQHMTQHDSTQVSVTKRFGKLLFTNMFGYKIINILFQ